MNNFGAYASVNDAIPYLLMENEHIYKTETNNWIYNNIKYWPENETVDFLAYSPYGNNNISVSYPDKNITCIIPDNPDNQFDLMAAVVADKNAEGNPVGLSFEHLLSRIDFTFNAIDSEKDAQVTINSFELLISENAVLKRGSYNITTRTWTNEDG